MRMSANLTDGADRSEELQNFVTLFELWINSARRGVVGGAESQARDDLLQFIVSGGVRTRIEQLRAAIQSLPNETLLLARLDVVETAIKRM